MYVKIVLDDYIDLYIKYLIVVYHILKKKEFFIKIKPEISLYLLFKYLRIIDCILIDLFSNLCC